MIILGVETSCDETALSLVKSENGTDITVLADKTLSQVALHQQYGGVFPNLAKREHLKNLPLMLAPLLKEAGLAAERPAIDAIAVTVGPGLEPCLWTGISFAEELAERWGVPIIPVNHMEGHIFSAQLHGLHETHFAKSSETLGSLQCDHSLQTFAKCVSLRTPQLPALALLISGGHTELVLIKKLFDYEIIGETRDDAVGEAFDKVARLLGLPYPGGHEISRLAETARRVGTKLATPLPRPMLHSPDYDFSFSGLKTAVLYLLKKIGAPSEETKMQIAREFEDAVTEVLVAKTKRALEEYGAQTLLIGGGVIANTHIRRAFEGLSSSYDRSIMINEGRFLHIPEANLTTDNALMIALAGLAHYKEARPRFAAANRGALKALGNLRLGEKIW